MSRFILNFAGLALVVLTTALPLHAYPGGENCWERLRLVLQYEQPVKDLLARFNSKRPKEVYYSDAARTERISFGYEAEALPRKHPNLLKYYKLPEYSEKLWKKIPHDRALKSVLKKISRVEEDSVVLEKMSNAPSFLSDHVIKDTALSTRLELNKNEISFDLNETFRQLDWIHKNIGNVDFHGHAAFDRQGVRLENAIPFLKWDFDITQAETLHYSFLKHVESGITPANNIVHWSSGIMDDISIKREKAAMRDVGINGLNEVDYLTKYVYGANFRRDIYVLDRAGYEIRNCLRRVECLKAKLMELAENIENGFVDYSGITTDELVVSKKLFRTLSFRERRFLGQVDRYLRRKFHDHVVGGADFKVRFTFPLIDWGNHPLIKQLSETQQTEFIRGLSRATQIYRESLKTISDVDLAIPERIKLMQITIARWGFDSDLHFFLKAGKQKFLESRKEKFN